MSKTIQSGRFPYKRINFWIYLKLAAFFTQSVKAGILLFFLFSKVYYGFAQKYSSSDSKAVRSYENALTAFDARNGDLALKFIEEALDRDPNFIETYFLRFEIYAEQRDLSQAEKALKEAVALNPDFFPNAWFFLGTVEMKQGKYEEAKIHLEKFKTYPDVNPEMVASANRELTNAAFALLAMVNPVDFNPKNMGEAINTSMPEYYPCISADGAMLIFTRLVDDPRAFQGKNEDFFVCSGRDDIWFPGVPLRGVNSVFNEGAPTLSSDGRTLVFTGCELMGDYGPGRKGYGSCDLFISTNQGGRWMPPQNLGSSINTANWETQPSLSSDGNTLYFIRGKSSRSGVQNQDIFFTKKQSDSSWSTPERLSDKVNTPDREESVHIHPDDNTLYFSSNGHPGMGGLDLYLSRRDTAGDWGTPINLGYPINTFADENSVLIAASGDLAFYASNRDGGFGDLDLYSFELPKTIRPSAVTFAQGRVTDGDSGEPLASVISVSEMNNTNDKRTFNSDAATGQFLVALTVGNAYALTVKADGYLLHSESFTLTDKVNIDGYALDIKLYKLKAGATFVLKNVFFDLDKDVLKSQSKPELNELISFLKANPELVLEVGGHTDNQGDIAYNKDLSLRRAEAVKSYLEYKGNIEPSRIMTKGYGANKPIDSNDSAEGRSKNRRTEFTIVR